MLSFLVSSSLADIYGEISALKAEVKKVERCDINYTSDVFEKIMDYLEEMMDRIDKALSASFISENEKYIKLITKEISEIEKELMSKCSPWYGYRIPYEGLYEEYEPMAVCVCGVNVCKGTRCYCTKDGCVAEDRVGGDDEIGIWGKSSKEYENPKDVVVYDISGRVVYKGDYGKLKGLKKGIYYLRSADGKFKKLIIK
jgi:hypothetical protein